MAPAISSPTEESKSAWRKKPVLAIVSAFTPFVTIGVTALIAGSTSPAPTPASLGYAGDLHSLNLLVIDGWGFFVGGGLAIAALARKESYRLLSLFSLSVNWGPILWFVFGGH